MAQLPSAARIDQYVASAGQTVFTYTYLIFSDEEIKVQLGDTTLVLTTDYTVQNSGNPTGGTITLVTGATLNDIITLTGDTYIQRVTEFQNNGDFLASAINEEYDILDDITSEILTETGGAFKLAVPSPTISTDVPNPVAGRCLKWNATGTAMEVSDFDPDVAQGSAAAAAVSAAAALVSENNAADSETEAAISAAEAAASAASIDLDDLESNIVPHTTSTYDIGTDLKRFDGLYADTVDVSVVDATNIATTNIVATGDITAATGDITAATFNGEPLSTGIDVNSAMYRYTVSTGTQGGSYSTSNTWQQRPINTEVSNNITGCSLASNAITLSEAGVYHIRCKVWCYGVRQTDLRLYDVTHSASAVVARGGFFYTTDLVGPGNLDTYVTTTESTTFRVDMAASTIHTTSGMGVALNYTGWDEIYLELDITKLGD